MSTTRKPYAIYEQDFHDAARLLVGQLEAEGRLYNSIEYDGHEDGLTYWFVEVYDV